MAGNDELLKKIDPFNYFAQFIAEGVYPDGREIAQFRPLSIEQCVNEKAYGSSYVQQGGACVSCTINVSIAPDSNEPPILFEFKALECVKKELLNEAHAHLTRIINQEKLLDLEQLKVVSADGFLTGAVLLAVQSAILCTRLPKVEYHGMAFLNSDSYDFDDIPLQFDITKLKIVEWDESETKMFLILKDFLVHISFLIYSGADGKGQSDEYKLLCDPSSELRALITNRCELTVGKNERIYSLGFNSSLPIQDTMLTEVLRLTKRRYIAITNAVDRSQRQLLQTP